jgi:ribokinase
MKKIAVIGSLNMDLVITTDRLPNMGETITGKNFSQIPGGKGANQGVACGRLGGNTRFLGKVGNDSYGNTLIESLKNAGVDTNFIIQDSSETTGIAMITVCNGENMIILNPGANGKVTCEDIESNIDVLEEADILMMQLEIPFETVEYIINKYKGSKTIILDPAPFIPLEKELLKGIDYITPNEYEAELLCNINTETEKGILEALDALKEIGVKYPIITLGSKGIAFYNGTENKIMPGFKVNAVDTTAAGDTFAGAFAVAMSKGETMENALLFAQKAAAIATTKFGAQSSIPSFEEVEKYLLQI